MIPLSANTAACLGFRVVGFTRRGVVVGVRLLAILLIVSNLPLNILLNALLLSVLKRAPVFIACLAGITAPVFLSIFISLLVNSHSTSRKARLGGAALGISGCSNGFKENWMPSLQK